MTASPTARPAATESTRPTAAWRGLLASIDMGSNSFRLEIAQCQGDRYRRVDYLKETVRLGGGLDAHGMLTEAAMQRGLDCLARFSQRLAGIGAHQVRAVATQTLREAANRNAFLDRAQRALGFPIEVISGREEARLIFAGVARLQPGEGPRLVIDIGGRSTEMILGTGRVPQRAESFRIGSVSLSMRFFPEGRYTAEAFRAAQVAAGAELEEAFSLFTPGQWREALGSSGTAGAVSQLLAANGVTDGTITPEGLRWCMERCIEAGHENALALPGLKPERRAVLGGGLSILYTLAVHFGIERLQPARGALRQGVIFDLAERLEAARDPEHHDDMRDAGVRELQQRFDVDLVQARRVQDLALGLMRRLDGAPRDAAARLARRELAWAAALHEVGMLVSHHDHHRHSAYLVGHADVAGFSQSQQRRLADLVLAQRGGLRKVESALAEPGFAQATLSLRLAVLLSHARADADLEGLRLRRDGDTVTLTVPARWQRAHPRSAFLLHEELADWAKVGALRVVLAD